MDLAQKKCKPCEGGTAPLTRAADAALLPNLDSAWALAEDARSIRRIISTAGAESGNA